MISKLYAPEGQISTDTTQQDRSLILDKLDLGGLSQWTEEQQQAAKDLLCKSADIFSTDMYLGKCNTVKHNMKLRDCQPYKERYIQISPPLYQEVKNHLWKKMLEIGAIRKSFRP